VSTVLVVGDVVDQVEPVPESRRQLLLHPRRHAPDGEPEHVAKAPLGLPEHRRLHSLLLHVVPQRLGDDFRFVDDVPVQRPEEEDAAQGRHGAIARGGVQGVELPDLGVPGGLEELGLIRIDLAERELSLGHGGGGVVVVVRVWEDERPSSVAAGCSFSARHFRCVCYFLCVCVCVCCVE